MKQKLLHLTLFFLLINYGLMAQPDSVNFTAFQGVPTDRGVALVWTTDGEHNVEGFMLERSLDAISFEEVARVNSLSDGGLHKEYHYDDQNIFREHVYYRITTLMPSGNKESNIIAVSRSNMDLPDIMIYPTITSQQVNIVKNSTENLSSTRLRVFNMSGNLLVDKPVNGNFLVESIDVSDYNAGAYVVELYNGDFATQAKFIKQQ